MIKDPKAIALDKAKEKEIDKKYKKIKKLGFRRDNVGDSRQFPYFSKASKRTYLMQNGRYNELDDEE